jgi:hypothetical protein
LSLYSAAAVAAGVALAQATEREVIVTRKNIPIKGGGSAYIDLNNEGSIADSEFSLTSYRNPLFHEKLFVKALTGGEMVGGHIHGLLGPYASDRSRSQNWTVHFSSARGQITIERKFQECCCSTNAYDGHWYYIGSNRYLGVKFLIRGETHYGWIRLTVDAPGPVTGTITSYAYETIANKRVSACESSNSADDTQVQENTLKPSLGMLALGADALALWGRE